MHSLDNSLFRLRKDGIWSIVWIANNDRLLGRHRHHIGS